MSILEARPGFDSAAPHGASANLVGLAERWPGTHRKIAAMLSAMAEAQTDARDLGKSRRGSGQNPISNGALKSSRFSGYTQNETATAWCGSNVAIAFVDTASEMLTLAGGGSVSTIGMAISPNSGKSFEYLGWPAVGSDPNDMLTGDPAIACGDKNTFYYTSLWSGSNGTSGVVLGKSTDGGAHFSLPATVIAKPVFSDFIGTDWLALNTSSPDQLYVIYVDTDFSGSLCGTDPTSGAAIARYAVEMVSSANGGASWSPVPTVIEQVCADSISPDASLTGSRVIVGPQGQVYAAWEAIGENGGTSTSRQIKFAESVDGGATFSVPVVVANVVPVGDGADLQGFIRANEFPSLAIGAGPKNNGVIYLAWNNGADAAHDALTTTATYAFADIDLAVSHDNGKSWSAPMRVNNNGETASFAPTDQYEPAVASDKSGRVAVCFYDRRRDPRNFLIDRECASSKTGGAPWVNKQITTTSFASVVGQDLLVAPDYMGDYEALASDATHQSAGFIDTYSTTVGGHPGVAVSRY
ncbi:MAG TPA: sialidase family protein [Candidatus Binataceae bacterium]|nr:sialidase family protein [Candidatus Binataceae bacterium]